MISIGLELNQQNKAYKLWVLSHFKLLNFCQKLSDLLQLEV
jgi:hypothetical protein